MIWYSYVLPLFCDQMIWNEALMVGLEVGEYIIIIIHIVLEKKIIEVEKPQ